MYKLIAIDLDGTLLNSYGEVSNRNKKAIEETLKKDVGITGDNELYQVQTEYDGKKYWT